MPLPRTTPLRLVALSVLAALLPLGIQGPAHAIAAPRNLTPAGPVSSSTPTLSWSRISAARSYEVQLDDDSGFGTPTFSATTTNVRSVPDKVLAPGTHYWRVRAVDANRVSSSWSESQFTVAAAAAPTPTAPTDGAVLVQPQDPALLTWTATQGATSYTVEVDSENDFVGALSYTTKATSLVVPDPLEQGTYFWRVLAVRGPGVVTAFSEPVHFEVSPLAAVQLVAPAAGAAVEDVVLDWQPVAGAKHYELEVSPDDSFSVKTDARPKVLGTRYSPPTTYDNGQYYWRVRAYDLGGNPSAWSEARSFERVWPDTITPLFPAGPSVSEVTGPMYFQWTPIQHATQYQLEVGSNENFSPGTFDTCQTAGTTYTPGAFAVNTTTGNVSVRTHEKCTPAPGQLTYWRVRALDRPFSKAGAVNGVQGLYTPVQAFVHDPAYFANVLPANGQTVDVPTLSWDPVRGAESYKLSIRTNTGTQVKSATTHSTSYTPFSALLDPAKSPFTWTIQAINTDGTQSAIYQSSFSVTGDVPVTGAAALTPLSGRSSDPATVLAPSLRWEPHPDAEYYRIEVGPVGTSFWFTGTSADVIGKNLPYPAVTDISTRFFAPGQYKWRAVAYGPGNAVTTGPTEVFTIASLAPVTGHRLALDGSAIAAGSGCSASNCGVVPTTPVLSWAPVPGAASYVVYTARDASFTNLTEATTAMAATDNTMWAPTMSSRKQALEDSQALQAFYWYVRPCKSTTVCGPDPVSSSGLADHSFKKQSPAVALGSPAAGATIGTSEVRFSWADYLTTNQAQTWGPDGEASHQSAMQYRIQVDDSESFASPIETTVVDQAEYTAFTKLYPDSTLWWRVQAVDAAGNALTWSEKRSFTKSSPSAVLSSPTGGANVAGTTPFRWTPQPFNAGYRIEVYKNDDTTFSLANRLFYKDVKTTAYAPLTPVPASSQAYVWRVRRVDASGNPGQWSATGRFRSQGAVPGLASPASGAFAPANGPLLVWHPVPGAATYTLETRSTTSTARLTGTPKTTPATAWAATAAVPDGTWEWRVTAKDSGGGSLGSSAWRRFRVDATRPTVTAKSPTTSAKLGANFRVRFSEPVKNVTTTTFRIQPAGSRTRLPAVVTLSADKKVAVLNPNRNLVAGRSYVIKVTSGVRDRNGNQLVATSWKVKAVR